MKKIILLFLLLATHTTECMQWLKHLRAANAYHDGDMQTAQRLLDDALTDDANDFQAAYNRGKVAYAQQDYEHAQAYFEKAAQVENNTQLKMQAWYDTGNAQVQQKKLEQAIRSYEEVLTLSPEHQEALKMLDQLRKILEQQKHQQQQQNNQKDQKNQQKNQQQNNDDNQQGDQQNRDDQKGDKDQDDQNNQNDGDSDQEQQQQNQGNDDGSKQQNSQNKRQQKEQEQEGAEDDHNKSHGQNRQQSEQQSEQDKKTNNSKQNNQHEQSSEQQNAPSSTNDGTQNEQKTQEADADGDGHEQEQAPQGPPDKYAQLFAALDERDASISKDMLKANLKDKMPHKYGQKNW